MKPVRRGVGEIARRIRPHLQALMIRQGCYIKAHDDEVAGPPAAVAKFLEGGNETVRTTHAQATGVAPVKIETNTAPGVNWIVSAS
jgi:hypothetical protein